MRSPTRLAPLALLAAPGLAQDFTHKLVPSDAAAQDKFGGAVALDGGRVLVGVSGKDDLGQASGAAYLFDAATGAQLDKWVASDGHAGQYFGSVARLDGGRALVTARHDQEVGPSVGAGYLFDVATGQELGKLLPPSGTFDDQYGWAADLDGDVVALASPFADDAGEDAGAVLLFDAATRQFVRALAPADLEAFDGFGYDVAVDGDLVLVGSRYDDDQGTNAGAAYVFDATTGAQLHKLVAPDGGPGQSFGEAVAIHGRWGVVGNTYFAEPFLSTGAAYVFDLQSGALVQRLKPSAPAKHLFFGSSVSTDGERVLVAATGDPGLGSSSGAAYVYDLRTGVELLRLTAPDGDAHDFFGPGALDGARAAIGARGDDDGGTDAGAVHVVGLGGPMGTRYCDPATPNSTGLAGVIGASGYEEVARTTIVLQAVQLPPGQFGCFLAGRTQGLLTPPGSQGVLCLQADIGVYRDQVRTTGAVGGFAMPVDPQDMPTNLEATIDPGETWHFSAWYRDANPAATSNFTDGVTVVFQ